MTDRMANPAYIESDSKATADCMKMIKQVPNASKDASCDVSSSAGVKTKSQTACSDQNPSISPVGGDQNQSSAMSDGGQAGDYKCLMLHKCCFFAGTSIVAAKSKYNVAIMGSQGFSYTETIHHHHYPTCSTSVGHTVCGASTNARDSVLTDTGENSDQENGGPTARASNSRNTSESPPQSLTTTFTGTGAPPANEATPFPRRNEQVLNEDNRHHETAGAGHDNTKPKLMISYAWRNKNGQDIFQIPRKIADDLKKKEYKVWIDTEKVTHGYVDERIADGLQWCDILIACLSPAYQNSVNCKKEFRKANDDGKEIIPIKLVDFKFNKLVGYHLSQKLYINFGNEAYEENFNKLLGWINGYWDARTGPVADPRNFRLDPPASQTSRNPKRSQKKKLFAKNSTAAKKPRRSALTSLQL